MSQSEFEKQIQILTSRLHTLRLAARGALSVQKVKVVAHTVPEHRVGAHTRFVYSRKERKAA
jgi:hypothetical protein